MPENKTKLTEQSVDDHIAAIAQDQKRADAVTLDALFREVSGYQPRMFGGSIIGYGSYSYTYDSGHSGVSIATGFAPRKSNIVLYIMPGYADFGAILARLGKHKIGKSCLYINKLADVDTEVLKELIRAGLDDLATRWPISPT
ncbi:MAG: DUF1801 domain-containing protein [Flavimaricola sp.]|nr:DUF1801 domain-containing protein [Flavimaricola sp.]